MPRGVPLTPEQLAKAEEVYAKTANFSAAARAVGVNESAIRRKLNLKRADVYARAHEENVVRVREVLEKAYSRASEVLENEVEPRDLAMLLGQLVRATELHETMIHNEQLQRNKNKQALLTRKETRKKIELIQATIDGKVKVPLDVDVDALLDKITDIVSAGEQVDQGDVDTTLPEGSTHASKSNKPS